MADRIIVTSQNSPYDLGNGKTYSGYKTTATDQDIYGGVVYAYERNVNVEIYGSGLTFSDNEVSATSADEYLSAYSAAVYTGGTATFNGKTTFSNNKVLSTSTTGRGSNSYGGAIYARAYPNMSSCTFNGETVFENNSVSVTTQVSESTNPQIFNARGGALCMNQTNVTFADKVTFTGNSATMVAPNNPVSAEASGGAVYAYRANFVFKKDAVFNSNSVSVTCQSSKIVCGGGAISNTGSSITFCGTVELQTDSDTWVNMGVGKPENGFWATITWDLTGGLEQYGNIKGFQRYSNQKHIAADSQEYLLVTQNITVKAEQAYGSYDIATGDLSDSTTDTLGKYQFNLTGATTSTQSIKVGDKFTNYGDKHYYTLAISDNGTTEDTTDDKLVLSVTDCGVSVDDSMTGKWFKKDEGITITGTYFSDSNVSSITFGGNTATLDAVAKTWSYTFASHDDTAGTEYDVVITSANSSYTATYTLKVDTVAPTVTVTRSSEGYVKDDVHWYKKDAAVTVTVTAEDATSGVDSVKYNDIAYTEPVTLDTSSESSSAKTGLVKAADKAGNETSTSFMFDVDGSGPVIGEVSADNFSGTSKYVDGNGKVWFKKDDATAALTVDIKDDKSGLKEAKYAGIAYADGKFQLATDVESGISTAITASDNVGNESQSASIAYKVDGTGPTVTITEDPTSATWCQSAVVTVAYGDGDGSGVKSVQYSFNGSVLADYTAAVTVTTNGTFHVVATDNVGNVTEKDLEITNIDTIPPTVTITADTKTIVEKLTISATAFDAESGVKVFEYSTDGGATWTPYQNDEKLFAKVNGTYIFHAVDKAQNITAESVTFENVYSKAEKAAEIKADDYELVVDANDEIATKEAAAVNDGLLTVNGKLTAANLLIADSKAAVSADGKLDADVVTLQNGVLDVADGADAHAGKVVVESGENTMNGFVDVVNSVEVAKAATLALDKNQFDEFMSTRRFQSDGKLNVSAVEGNDLTEANVKQLINANTVRKVNFAQDLTGIHDLVFAADSALNIGFQDGYGTAKSDRVVAKANSTLVLGTADYTLDLAEGKNAFYVRNNADVTLNSKLLNVTELTVNSGKKQSVGGVKTQAYTNAKFADVEFSDKYNAAFTVGKFAVVDAGAVTGNAKSDKLTVGSNSAATFGEVTGFESITVSAGSKYTPASGAAKVQGTTVAEFTSITAGEKLVLTTGSNSFVFMDSVEGSDKADTLTVGKSSAFGADSIALSGGDDKVTVSAKASVMVANFSMGVGKDTLSVGDDANMNVSGLTQFDSDDSVTVAKNAVVVFKALAPDDGSAITLKKFTLGKNAEAYLSTELVGAVTKADKTAQVFDIGDSNVAMSFTDIETETGDNTFETAGDLSDLSEDYNGWLNSSLDVADFFEIGSADELTWQADSGLEVKLYDENGVGTLVTGGSAVTTGYKAFAVSVADGEAEKKSYWYTAKLA